MDILRAKVANGGEWSIEGPNDVGNGDVGWGAIQSVAALGSALAGYQSGLSQLTKDAFEELRGDSLRLRQSISLGELLRVDRPGSG